MANKIVLKKSSEALKVPAPADLDYGELALNFADGKLYYKTAANNIASFNASAGASYSAGDGLSLTGFQFAVDNTVLRTTGSYADPSWITSLNYSKLTGTIPTWNQNTTGSAATLTTSRTIALTGDVTYTSDAFNGSANVTGTATLATVNANVGAFGSATAIPVVTVNAKGLITAISTTAVSIPSGAITITGDVSGSGTTGSSTTLTLATVNSNVGTWNNVTVNGKGLVTAGSNVAYLTTEADTLQTVTTRGSTTTTASTFNGGLTVKDNLQGTTTVAGGDFKLFSNLTGFQSLTIAGGVLTTGTDKYVYIGTGLGNHATSTTEVEIGSSTTGSLTKIWSPLQVVGTISASNLSGTNTGDNPGVTSVATSGTVSGLTLTGGTITTTGTITLGGTLAVTAANFASQTANTVLAAPNGSAGTPTFRSLVAADIPNLDAAKITSGTIDAARLPSYVDDVIEAANLAAFPATGETGKIYVALDTNKTYRWSGSAYVYITSGAVDSVGGYTGIVGPYQLLSALTSGTEIIAINIGGTGATTAAGALTSLGAYAASNPSGYTTNTGTVTGVTATAPVASSGGTAPVISMAAASSGVNGYMTGAYATKLDGIASGATANTGTVTGVTGTAPIVSSGGTAPAISISAATTSAAGSMSAADKTKLDGIASGATTNTGTVTSVATSGTVSGLTLTGGTITTTGTITLGGTLAVTAANFASQTANTFLAAPNGAAGVPTFRTLVAADVPTLNQNTTGSAAYATSSSRLYSTDASYAYGSAAPYYGYLSYVSANSRWRFAVTPATPAGVEVAYADTAGSAGSAGTVTSRTLTIGNTGKAVDHSANVSWTLAEIGAYAATNPNGYTTNTGTVTGVTATTPIVSSGGTAPVITHAASGVGAGTYNNVTVNTFGHVTSGSNTAYLTGYTETDTLSTVATRGNSYINPNFGGISIGETFANYNGWATQLNVHGAGNARMHVKTSIVNMGMYAHDSWQAVSGTNAGGFVGTYNNYPLSFLVNATQVGVFNTSGYFGIGTNSPINTLEVKGIFAAPLTSGSAQNGIARFSQASGAGSLDIGFGDPYSWLQSRSSGNYATNYNLVLNPNGGNVGVGTTNPGYKLEVNGSFAATTKSFVIDHPTKEGWKLRYGSLEGPENGVYIRGKLKGNNKIELPEYWTKLVDPDSISVTLTPIGKHQKLYVEEIADNVVTVGNDGLFAGEINCFFVIYGERVDVDKLIVEIE